MRREDSEAFRVGRFDGDDATATQRCSGEAGELREGFRRQMLDHQVRAWAVLNSRVLDALGSVPREKFVPSGLASLAFADTEIPIGHGQDMMTPTVEGRVLQALDLDPADTVLEIGTGSGFLTACLATLAGAVTEI